MLNIDDLKTAYEQAVGHGPAFRAPPARRDPLFRLSPAHSFGQSDRLKFIGRFLIFQLSTSNSKASVRGLSFALQMQPCAPI
jgi:hypothetical protein